MVGSLAAHYVLVASNRDPAGVTMIDYLTGELGFHEADNGNDSLCSFACSDYKSVRLCVSSTDLLHLENLDEVYPKATAFIFLSKHKSDSKIPALTCHCTGNFGDNPFGGNPREIAISFPSLQKSYLKALTAANARVPAYEIVIEASHHGPTSLGKPLLFVELGSSAEQWSDRKAASAICDVMLRLLENGFEHCRKVGVALGGTHYPTKFNQLLLESEFGLAAIASKHNLAAVDEGMLDQMICKSLEKVTSIVLDSKGLGTHKGRIVKLAEKSGLEVVKV
ncbi:MAG: D-aminoacyl-tRNA deacylase [Nitrososphaera sp.]